MYINYIILAHKNPEQLKRLINCLKGPNVAFYIHIDKNVDITPFISYLKPSNTIFFLEADQRESGVWGGNGVVRGTLNAMKKIVEKNKKGYCVLLTGQDYPLQNNDNIHSFFESNWPNNFISFYQTPGNWHNEFKPRIEKYKFHKSLKRGHFLFLPSIFDKDFYSLKTLGKLNFLRKTGRISEWLKVFQKRIFPNDIKAYGGGVYWAFPSDTVAQILDYVSSHPEYLEFHEYTLCADEVFFHSLIMHLQSQYKYKIKPSVTYANWDRKSGPLPVTFERNDFEELKKAPKNYLFARKFDIKIDQDILDKCDKEFLK